MAGGLASGRGYSPMLPMTLGGEDLRTMSWMKLNDLYKAEEEEAWVNGFSKMVNAMYAKDTGKYYEKFRLQYGTWDGNVSFQYANEFLNRSRWIFARRRGPSSD